MVTKKIFILHTWDANLGDSAFIGTEIIGYDEKEAVYFTHFFDNSGFHPEYKARVDGNIWNFIEPSSRAKVTVDDDKNKMTSRRGQHKLTTVASALTSHELTSNNTSLTEFQQTNITGH